ncbi:MAG: hypothetical protein IGQ88_05405 [Gloeomargaritaceae cyanobacterium C42_A2020_066]|nr:hypothetical protein [Gloeomargaritaceae cyanobacterium C42_A2020_066]
MMDDPASPQPRPDDIAPATDPVPPLPSNLDLPLDHPQAAKVLWVELALVRQQTQYLVEELQLCQATAEEQQNLIDRLAQELEGARQQVAELERQCTLQQQQCQALETELHHQHTLQGQLESRLYRQQQDNLQLRGLLYRYVPGTELENHPLVSPYSPIPPWPDVEARPAGPVPKPPGSVPLSPALAAVDLPRFLRP